MSPEIDWFALATALGSITEDATGRWREEGGRQLARLAVETIVGPEALAQAVDHYVDGRPGAELARSVLRLVQPWSAMLRCYQLFKSDPNPQRRTSAVELLRVVADARALPWVAEFLDDHDPAVQFWGISVIDQLLAAGFIELAQCQDLLDRALAHTNPAVREKATEIIAR